MKKEFQQFNFISLFGQTLGVFKAEYDGQSEKIYTEKREKNLEFFNFKIYSYLSSDVSSTQL